MFVSLFSLIYNTINGNCPLTMIYLLIPFNFSNCKNYISYTARDYAMQIVGSFKKQNRHRDWTLFERFNIFRLYFEFLRFFRTISHANQNIKKPAEKRKLKRPEKIFNACFRAFLQRFTDGKFFELTGKRDCGRLLII